MAALDLFVVIIPTDGLVVASVFAKPKRWYIFALAATLGSTIGAVLLGAFIYFDAAWLSQQFPSFFQSSGWARGQELINAYGAVGVFIGAIGPFLQQPFVIIPALGNLDPLPLIGWYFLGRYIKFNLVCWLASYSPALISKIPGVGRELNDYAKRTQTEGVPEGNSERAAKEKNKI